MCEISEELDCKPIIMPTTQSGYAEYMDRDVEKQGPDQRTNFRISLPLGRQQTRDTDADRDSIDEILQAVMKRLREEFGDSDVDSETDRDGDGDGEVSENERERDKPARQGDSTAVRVTIENENVDVDVEEGEGGAGGVKTRRRATLRLTEGRDMPSVSSFGVSTPYLQEELQEQLEGQASAVQTSSSTTAVQVTLQPTNPPPHRPRNSSVSNKHPYRCMHSLRRVFDNFAADQHAILSEALISGHLHGADDKLRIVEPLPSLRDMYDYRYVPSKVIDAEGKIRRRARKRRKRYWMEIEGGQASYASSGAQTPVTTGVTTPVSSTGNYTQRDTEIYEYYEILRAKSEKEQLSNAVSTASHHSLTRVYSFVFAME